MSASGHQVSDTPVAKRICDDDAGISTCTEGEGGSSEVEKGESRASEAPATSAEPAQNEDSDAGTKKPPVLHLELVSDTM